MKMPHPFHFLTLVIILMTNCSPGTNNSTRSSGEMTAKEKHIFFENQVFNEPLVFTEMSEAYRVSAAGKVVDINIPVTYINCTFNEDISAYTEEGQQNTRTIFYKNLTFIGCTFKKTANFRGITVNGICIFENCTFEGLADFQAASFLSESYFNSGKFYEEAKFQNSYFGRTTSFLESEFSQTCSFQGSVFNMQAQFGVAKFYGYTDFTLCDFRGGAFFNYAELPDRAYFNNSWFQQRAEFNSSIINEMEMKDCTFTGKTAFEKVTIGKLINLEKSTFYTTLPSFDPVYRNLVKLENIKILSSKES